MIATVREHRRGLSSAQILLMDRFRQLPWASNRDRKHRRLVKGTFEECLVDELVEVTCGNVLVLYDFA